MSPQRPLALIVVTEDWYFCSHRLPLARALRDAGYRVAVATRVAAHGGRIEAEGFELLPLPALQRGLAAWREMATVVALASLYRRLRPALVVHIALKPVVLGTLAGRLSGRPPTLNLLTGMGFVFTSSSMKARLFRRPIAALLGALLDDPGILTVVQNSEDFQTLTAAGVLPPGRTRLVRGSGVDVGRFLPLPEPGGPFTAAAVCRLLGDKGVYDLIEAVRILRSRGSAVRLLLAGPLDPLNPTAVRREEVLSWRREGLVEWDGPVDDVREVWSKAHAAVLPSHREGLPKALLEAAACGRPIVTTDTTGCREVVAEGVNGFLVPLRDPVRIAAALERLASDEELRRRMGAAGRRRVVDIFAESAVVGELVSLCRGLAEGGLLEGPGRAANLDCQTVEGFGAEWSRFDQTGLPPEELTEHFDRYFSIFPWSSLGRGAVGFDLGCGSGRWAKIVAQRVHRLHCIDASRDALAVARRNLAAAGNCEFHLASVDSIPLEDSSMDFGYSLGVLHHVPDTRAGLLSCARKLKPGAPFLLYLYYRLENRALWYRALWHVSDWVRAAVSRCPIWFRMVATGAIAAVAYLPLARAAAFMERRGLAVGGWPLAFYRHSSFYTMRTDAFDRFATPLEQRFSRDEILRMMNDCGLEQVRFSDSMPYWVAVGVRR